MCKIRDKGGRFVRLKNDVWSIIPTKACRLKIAHAIQYHIRNEFSQRKPEVIVLPVSSGEEQNFRDHIAKSNSGLRFERERIVRDIEAKLAWLQTHPESESAISTPCHRTGSNTYDFMAHSCDLQTGGTVSQQREKDFPSSTEVLYNIVSPYLDRKITSLFDKDIDLGRCDQPRNMHANEMANERSVHMYGHDSDGWENLVQQMPPSNQPNSQMKSGTWRLQPLTHLAMHNGDPKYVHRSASLPNRIDDRLVDDFSIDSPMSRRAHSFCLENLKSLECMLHHPGAPNQVSYHTSNLDFSTNIADTFTDADQPIPYAPYNHQGTDQIGKSELEVELFDDTGQSDTPFMEGDLGLFRINAAHEFDNLTDDFEDVYMGTSANP
jgi:hypothetical protein